MSKKQFYVGIDIASETFVASIFQSPKANIITKESISNNPKGFEELINWLKKNKVRISNSIICMENTGIYSKAIVHYLFFKGYAVCEEQGLKVKRAFDPVGHKTDAVDSKQIAEYAFRYFDELRLFKPKDEIVEKIRQLLSMREQLTKQSVATQNAVHSYQRSIIKQDLVINLYRDSLKQIKNSIAKVDEELKELINNDPDFFNMNHILKSIPGFGPTLSASLLVLTQGFGTITNHKSLSAYLGMCPYQYQSGTSINRKAHIRHFGPSYSRKLLHLAARSVVTHNRSFRLYYLRKLEQGKAKKLVLNNVANKLIKIACASIRDRKLFIDNYKSINPNLLCP